MAETGIEISEQTSDSIESYFNDRFDFVITVCDKAAANCPVFPGTGTKRHWLFDDPDAVRGKVVEILYDFRCIRDEISLKIEDWLGRYRV